MSSSTGGSGSSRPDPVPNGPGRDGAEKAASDAAGREQHERGHGSDSLNVRRATEAARERERFGGIKVGSAFFGWLTATGTAVLLTALVAAAGTAVGVATHTDAAQAVNQATANPGTVGLTGIIILLVILLIAYYCGGYVAGRMARFNGLRQGFMVWLWAVIIAVIVALLGAVAGQKFNILANLNSFPRIPVNEGQLTGAGILALVAVAIISLVGALLGGLAGMHFHRKVDAARFAGTTPARP